MDRAPEHDALVAEAASAIQPDMSPLASETTAAVLRAYPHLTGRQAARVAAAALTRAWTEALVGLTP